MSKTPTLNFATGELLLVNKPAAWTSFDVVNKLKGLIKAKIGHAGTLDPMATGLLILCTGSFTKKLTEFQTFDKGYTGTLMLGASTASFDAETPADQTYPTKHITEEMIRKAALKFIGKSQQQAPVYSALKVNGQPMYKLAREGNPPIPKTREVIIDRFEITGIEMPMVHFEVECGKGTYIRSLAHDLGSELGSGAYLTALTRTRIGPHKLEDAWELAALVDYINTHKYLIQR